MVKSAFDHQPRQRVWSGVNRKYDRQLIMFTLWKGNRVLFTHQLAPAQTTQQAERRMSQRHAFAGVTASLLTQVPRLTKGRHTIVNVSLARRITAPI